MYVYIYIYISLFIYRPPNLLGGSNLFRRLVGHYMWACSIMYAASFGRGGDKVGNPHRAQISQFELFELILLLKLDKRVQGSVKGLHQIGHRKVPSVPPLLLIVLKSPV